MILCLLYAVSWSCMLMEQFLFYSWNHMYLSVLSRSTKQLGQLKLPSEEVERNMFRVFMSLSNVFWEIRILSLILFVFSMTSCKLSQLLGYDTYKDCFRAVDPNQFLIIRLNECFPRSTDVLKKKQPSVHYCRSVSKDITCCKVCGQKHWYLS